MPKITVKRSSNWFWMVRKLNVRINNEEVGQIGNGETKTYEVKAGENIVFTHLKGGKSKELIVDVQDNSDVRLIVEPSKFDILSVLIMLPLIPIVVLVTGTGLTFYVIFAVTFVLLFLIRRILNITAFVLSQE